MKEQILDLRNKGFSYKEIKETLGCSKGTISFHCSKMNGHKNVVDKNTKKETEKRKKIAKTKTKIRRNTPKPIKLEKNLSELEKIIIELYSVNGLSTNMLADIFNLKLKEVRQICYSNAKRKFCNKNPYEQIKNYRKKIKLTAILYKGSKCKKCGYNDNIAALDFHHLDLKEKDFGISASHVGWDKLKKELDKCIILCSNCHREEHNKDMNLDIVRVVADWEAHS